MRCEITRDRVEVLRTAQLKNKSHLDGVGWGVQQLCIKIEEGRLGQAALVQATLVCAVHHKAQQVCSSSTHIITALYTSHEQSTAAHHKLFD